MTAFDFITAEHFQPQPDRQQAIRLFQRSVVMVEIEIFSYCNRVCWFCPNAVIDRRSGIEHMPEPLYLGILAQLAEASYRGTISYSRYNEPLADRIILQRLTQAKQQLPAARLHTNTNGDYLTRAYLDDLQRAGLESLNIQIYLGNQDRYDHERMRGKLAQTIEKLGLTATMTVDEPGTWLEASAVEGSLRLRLYARNFESTGCDRGGSVPIAAAAPRTSPCLSPFHHVYIDYNGSVMPCCNLRSDVEAHRETIIANLHQQPDLFAIYAGETMAAWRRGLIGFEPKAGLCASCSFVTYAETPEHVAVHARLRESLLLGARAS